MIKPVNNHLLIEPVVHESFIASQNDTFQEIGIVVACDDNFAEDPMAIQSPFVPKLPATRVKAGDKVYFDSWLAAKYPKADGKDGEFYWLVRWEDVRAIEHVEPEISK